MNITKNIGKITRFATVIVALAGLTLLTSNVMAQEKGAERLMKLHRLNTGADIQKVVAGDTIVMSCPKCKDTWVSVVQPVGRSGQSETATVMRHACPGCSTKIVTDGVGKSAKDTVKHVCTNCGSEDAFCCVMKKSGTTTPGMGQHK